MTPSDRYPEDYPTEEEMARAFAVMDVATEESVALWLGATARTRPVRYEHLMAEVGQEEE